MNGSPSPSRLRIAFATLVWVAAMAMILLGGIVGGTGRVVLTVFGIVLLLLAVAYIGLQVWWLNRVQQRARASQSDPGSPPRR
ncbi:MAG: hypothetical protein ABSH07_00230 [Candidatus Dormibacteria bacterium]|jgi:predicted lipid-binding transport protein (Tim44 family)